MYLALPSALGFLLRGRCALLEHRPLILLPIRISNAFAVRMRAAPRAPALHVRVLTLAEWAAAACGVLVQPGALSPSQHAMYTAHVVLHAGASNDGGPQRPPLHHCTHKESAAAALPAGVTGQSPCMALATCREAQAWVTTPYDASLVHAISPTRRARRGAPLPPTALCCSRCKPRSQGGQCCTEARCARAATKPDGTETLLRHGTPGAPH